MDGNIKDVREFWKEKVKLVEKSKTTTAKSRLESFPSSGAESGDEVYEAKRRNNEELVEVLRRRQSSNSPEPPCVTSSLSRSHPARDPVRIGKVSSTSRSTHDRKSNLHDRLKRITVATTRTDIGRRSIPTRKIASQLPASSSPYKMINLHDSLTVANKMAERMNSLKKITSKPHPPLRPASSTAAECNRQSPPPIQKLTLKKRPFSTSAADVSTQVIL